jgi:hypothetical protein
MFTLWPRPRRRAASCRLSLTALEGRTVPAVAVAIGADAGGGPHVKVFDENNNQIFSFFAYDPAFAGGVHVGVADVNGDGTVDIITGAGRGGGPHVKVFSGTNLALLASFFAYDPAFQGGVFVAGGDINGDGKAEIVTGPGTGGGPHVKVFDVFDPAHGQVQPANTPLASFFAYDLSVTGGISVAAGDLDGDNRDEVITAPFRGATHVKAFNAGTGATVQSFFAFDPSFVGGANLSTGDIDLDGRDDVLTGAGLGGGGETKVFSGVNHNELSSLSFFDSVFPSFTGGVRVAPLSISDGTSNTVTLVGTPSGGFTALTVSRDARTGNYIEQDSLFGGFTGGAFVATNRNSIIAILIG